MTIYDRLADRSYLVHHRSLRTNDFLSPAAAVVYEET
jgi:hypothetical protein